MESPGESNWLCPPERIVFPVGLNCSLESDALDSDLSFITHACSPYFELLFIKRVELYRVSNALSAHCHLLSDVNSTNFVDVPVRYCFGYLLFVQW